MKSLTLLMLNLLLLKASSQPLRQQLHLQYPDAKDIKITRCKYDSNLYIALLITELHWWEEIKLIKFKNGHTLWVAEFDTVNTGQAILSARQISLKGIPFPLFEIFDHTHQGNGFYYLYRLEGKKAIKIAETRAVDWSFDGSLQIGHHYKCSIIYKNGHLIPFYKDLNNDGHTDITLKGAIQIYADDDKTLLKQYPAQKVFLYDIREKKFIENLKQRKGFRPDDD